MIFESVLNIDYIKKNFVYCTRRISTVYHCKKKLVIESMLSY